MIDFEIIAAHDDNFGIGKDGKLSWNCPEDLAHFKEITHNGILIMGRKTWESLPIKPLPGRINIVIASEGASIPDYYVTHSLQEALSLAADVNHVSASGIDKTIFVIGGGKLFKEALPLATVLHITEIPGDYQCDVFFPPYRVWGDEEEIVWGETCTFKRITAWT